MKVYSTIKSKFTTLLQGLNKPESPIALAIFRISFGVIMLWDLIRILKIDLIKSFYPRGVVFPYERLELPLISEGSLHLLFYILIISTVLIALGVLYKYAMIVFTLGFSYFFFLDQTLYNNHLYLIILLGFLMIFIPADSALSLNKKNYNLTIPKWCYSVLQFQILLVYFFGALSKLNPFWFSFHPVKEILEAKALSSGMTFLTSEGLQYVICYGGFLFDLLIGALLLFPPTKKLAFVGVVLFSLGNAYLFSDIYIFPFFMIASLILFINKNWLQTKFIQKENKNIVTNLAKNHTLSCIGLGLVSMYFLFQMCFPIRHYFIKGYVDWTGDGSSFAWRMKIQNRKIDEMTFAIFDVDKKEYHPVDPSKLLYPDEINLMANSPLMITQFARFLERTIVKRNGIQHCLIKSKVKVSFNGQESQYIFDPELNLLEIPAYTNYHKWVLPMTKE